MNPKKLGTDNLPRKGRWDGVDEFIQVVKTGSFTSAARNLSVSRSHISKQIQRLEDRLKTQLLQRSTRKLALTDAGALVFREFQSMSQLYDDLESNLSDLHNRLQGTLKVAINSRYGVRYMASAIAAFSARHPDITVQLHTSYDDVDLIGDGYDLTIRYGSLEDSTLVARKLGGYTMRLYCSPAYLSKQGVPQSIDELKGHNALCTPECCWFFNGPNAERKLRVKGSWVSEDGTALLAATLEGLGIAQLPDFFVQEHLKQEELVAIPGDWNFYWRQSWAVFDGKTHISSKVRHFIDFICKEMPEDKWLSEKEVFYKTN